MKLPQKIEINGIRVLTTSQIAEAYETKEIQIYQNFKNNRIRFTEGKHYISLSGDELKAFKKQLEKIEVVKSRTSHLYLWTEKGGLLHAKSLNTKKAWEVYDYLVDFYFREKEEKKENQPVKKPLTKEVVDIPENPQMLKAIQKLRDDLTCMDVLLQRCVRYTSEKTYKDTRSAAMNVVSIMVDDWNKLCDTKYNLIQKRY